MRIVFGVILVVLAFAVAEALPAGVPPPPDKIVDLQDNGLPNQPTVLDNDGDGYWNFMDCNDDNAAINPGAKEILNGNDDDCDGVIDNGFDRSVDWPTPQVVKMLWPDNKALNPDEMISIDGTPRLVWADSAFAVVWSDHLDRLRLALVDERGKLVGDNSPRYFKNEKEEYLLARVPDIAWTGSHIGIVFEDTSGATAGVRLLILKSDGTEVGNFLVAELGGQPKIVWAQDRFGVVWRAPYCAGDCVRFQRFDIMGRPIGSFEILKNSGWGAQIAFTGTEVQIDATRFDRHDGSFGIVYEAYYGAKASSDVLLAVFPLEPYYILPEPIKVNEIEYPYSALGSRPAIAANPAGFAVSWHVAVEKSDGARLRLIPLDGLQTVQEFTPDSDAGRASNIIWTGSEFVVVNDNIIAGSPQGSDIHFRRIDSSCNSHLAAGWGPWQEVNLSTWTPGTVSVNPHAALGRDGNYGVAWVEQEELSPALGRIWFAIVRHR